MPAVQIEKEQLLNAVPQMPQSELEEFVRRAFSFKAREYAPALSERESELLLQINKGLPAQTRKRLNELIGKRQSYTINQDELQELRQLTDQIEKSDAERLKCLIELAAPRNVPLDNLIKQLGLKPSDQSQVDNEPLIGSMKGQISINGDIFSTDLKWDAQS